MMKSETFLDAKAQIEGAEAQIHEVEANIAEFIKSGPYELVAKRDHEAGIDIWRYRLREQLPRRVRVIIRHVLINLRAPLDHLAHELAIQYSGSATRQAAFPFGRTRSAFERELPKKTEKMSPAAVKLICDCEPYPTSSDYSGGNDILFALHELNRADKHFRLVPINLQTTANMSELAVYSGRVLTVGPRQGRHFVRDQNNDLSQPVLDRQPRFSLGSPSRIVFGIDGQLSAKESMEMLTTLPNTKFTADFRPSLNIAFRDIEALQGEPVVAALNQMCDAVAGILTTFEKEFFS
jgi:hypothetical protein